LIDRQGRVGGKGYEQQGSDKTRPYSNPTILGSDYRNKFETFKTPCLILG
jgi:hypothetical protein